MSTGWGLCVHLIHTLVTKLTIYSTYKISNLSIHYDWSADWLFDWILNGFSYLCLIALIACVHVLHVCCDRFSLLLLEPGEIYFQDFSVTFYPLDCSEDESLTRCVQQQQAFNGLCSGTTRVGWYQKKHSASCLSIGLCCIQAGFPHLLSSGFLWSGGR